MLELKKLASQDLLISATERCWASATGFSTGFTEFENKWRTAIDIDDRVINLDVNKSSGLSKTVLNISTTFMTLLAFTRVEHVQAALRG